MIYEPDAANVQAETMIEGDRSWFREKVDGVWTEWKECELYLVYDHDKNIFLVTGRRPPLDGETDCYLPVGCSGYKLRLSDYRTYQAHQIVLEQDEALKKGWRYCPRLSRYQPPDAEECNGCLWPDSNGVCRNL